jgi:hypothetical protein
LMQSNAQTNDSDYVFPDTTWKYLEKPDTILSLTPKNPFPSKSHWN